MIYGLVEDQLVLIQMDDYVRNVRVFEAEEIPEWIEDRWQQESYTVYDDTCARLEKEGYAELDVDSEDKINLLAHMIYQAALEM